MVALYQIELHPRVAPPRLPCGLLLLAWARGAGRRLHLLISPTSVGGVWSFRQPHAVVISVTCRCGHRWRLGAALRFTAVGGADVDGEACSVVAVFVVSLHGCEGELGGVAVDHDEDRVFFPAYQAGLRNLLL